MQCSEAKQRLSAFHDGELPPAEVVTVEAHLAGCEACRRELDTFRRLSELAARLRTGDRPHLHWQAIESQLPLSGRSAAVPQTGAGRGRIRRMGAGLVSAAAVVTLLMLWLLRPEHSHIAADFDEFLDRFESDLDGAQAVLLSNYNGQQTTIEDARGALRYQPVVARRTPDGYSLRAVYLLRMPCCTCLEAVYARDAGGYVCVFEHDGDQPIWFGKRPSISAQCQGHSTRLVQINGTLAATWPVGQRHVTVIGASSIDEVSKLVDAFPPQDQG